MNKKTCIILFPVLTLLSMVVLLIAKNVHQQKGSFYRLTIPGVEAQTSFEITQNRPKVNIQQDNSRLSFEIFMDNAALSKEKGDIVYKSSSQPYEIRYRLIPNGMKEEIILDKPPNNNRFELKMTLNNLKMEKNGDSLPIFFDQNRNYQFHFQKPFAQDAKGEISYALNYEISKIPKEASYLLTLVVDQTWLNDPRRVYPIVVDPTIINDPKTAKPEIIEKRTTASKTFNNNDGSYTLQAWVKPVHYEDDYQQFQDIDTTIVPSDDPNYDYMNITNNSKVWFSSKAFGDNNIKLSKEGAVATLSTIFSLTINNHDDQGRETIESVLTKTDLETKNKAHLNEKITFVTTGSNNQMNKLTYHKIYENEDKYLDLSYLLTDDMLREEIILNKFQGFPEITQKMTLENAYLRQAGEQIQIIKTDTNEILWTFSRPNMQEEGNRDPEKINYGVHFQISCQDSAVDAEKCRHWLITKTFDQEGKNWLTKANYPVIIDPTLELQPSAATGQDTYIRPSSHNNYGIATTYSVWQGGKALLRFPLSEISSEARVNSSSLTLTVNAAIGTTRTLSVHHLSDANGDWIEGTKNGATAGSGEPSWYGKTEDGAGNVVLSWAGTAGLTTAGTDWTTTAMGTISWLNSWAAGTSMEISLDTDTVQSWCGQETNNGMVLRTTTTEFISGALYLSDVGTASYRPKLSVTYTDPFPPGTQIEGVSMQGVQIGEIASPAPQQYTSGPNDPGTIVDDATVGTISWANPDNAQTSNDVYATATTTSDATFYTHYLKATNFGFSIPDSATIDGIKVEIEKTGPVVNATQNDSEVKIVKADGSIGTANKADTVTDWGSVAEAYYTHGSSTDLWEETWAPSDINDTDFGVVISAKLNSSGIVPPCLDKDTQIFTPDGNKKIAEMKPGESIFSYNEKFEKIEITKVNSVWSSPIANANNRYFYIYSNEKTIKATENHKFFVNGSYVRADELKVNDLLLGEDLAMHPVDKIEITGNSTDTVWDLSVEDNHNFFADGFLVHNAGTHGDIDHIRITIYYTN